MTIFPIVVSIICLLSAWKWGDWKKFEKHYPTLAYVTVGNLIYKVNALLNFHLWKVNDGGLLSHETIYFIYLLLIMIPAIFVYLSKFPETRIKKILYVFAWIVLFTVMEWIGMKYFNAFNHYHGWNIWWSLLFDSVMFPMLRLHFVNYKLALLLSIPCTLFMLIMFNYI
ncbi:CBO0543 family protein [Neobacillus endophyticus]|uniref:CBO0543 family protein n=1 Tax=Neobacillus endophyticus TaxID=2738405 RepID=UPI001C278EA7|nr:CBO0543 family protein [Neobacillus endophyticus]